MGSRSALVQRNCFCKPHFVVLSRASPSPSAAIASSPLPSPLGPHPPLTRSVSSTGARFSVGGWFEKIKGAVSGKSAPEAAKPPISLVDFANQMDTARKMGSFKNFVVGRFSEATVSSALEKQATILRYLGSIDPLGENLQSSQKQDAAKHCNCTVADVENALAKFTWAKNAQKKLEKLQEEGKPMPKTFAEVQKLLGSSPMDGSAPNSEKANKRVNKNDPCPCGSNKKYKRCCGTAEW